MKKSFLLLSFLITIALTLSSMPAMAQEEAASDDPLVEGLPDDVPQPEQKKATKKKTSKQKSKKKTTKKSSKKKKKKKQIYVDEYKFQTHEFEVEKISYKFNRSGDPIISQKAGVAKSRQFGKDYTQYWQPSIKTKASKNSNKKYSKPNSFDDNSKKSSQSDELTLPDGLGQPNGLIAVDPIIEEKPR